MIPTPQTDEILDFITATFDALDSARDDDGRISAPEVLGMVRLTPALLKAVGGLGELEAEWRAMSQEKLDAMREEFLTRRNWQPSDDARDRAAVIFKIASALILGLIQWRNTAKPPRPQIVE